MVFEKVQEMISAQLNIKPESITRESNIIVDLHADSLDVVELLMSLEDEYGIKIPDEDSNSLVTVGALVDYVESLNK